MRSKVTVVLLFLNVVLFAYIYYFDQPRIEGTLTARRRVLPPEIASLDSFTRTTRNGETVKLEKRGESWWLAQPFEWPANPDAVAHVHNELQFLENETSFPVAELGKSGQSLADYGLVDPAMTLVLTAAGQSYTLKVGDDTEIGKRLYVLSPDGTRVHVVGRSLIDTVGLPVGELRKDAVFTIPVFEVRSLNIQTAAPANLKVRLRRDSTSRWGFESPILARASKPAVEVTINGLNSLTVKSFLATKDSDPDRTGLNAPALRVTLEGNARRETLLLGNAAPTAGDYFAKIEDKAVVFTVTPPPALLKVLRLSQENLRDTHVADFDPGQVSAVILNAPGQPELALQKLDPLPAAAAAAGKAPAVETAAAWQVVTRTPGQAPVTIPGDSQVIADLIQKVQALSARVVDGAPRFLSDAPAAADLENFGFNRPEREITLSLNTGGGITGNDPSTQVVQVGIAPEEPGRAFARLTQPPFVYEVLPDILDQTPVVARHYRQRLLRELPASARIMSLGVIDLATNAPLYSQKLQESDKDWTAAVAAEPENLRPAIIGLLNGLRRLRAAEFVADSFSTEHATTAQATRPWRYRIDYTVAFNGSDAATATPGSLLLTERLGGAQQLAGTADFGGVVFNLPQEWIDALFPLLYAAKNDPGAQPPAVPSGDAAGTVPVPAPANPAAAPTTAGTPKAAGQP